MARPPKRPPARSRAPKPAGSPAARSSANKPTRPAPGRVKSAPLRKARPPAEGRSPRPSPAKPPARPKGLWLYGRHAVLAALKNPRRSCHRLLATGEALEKVGDPGRSGLEVKSVPREEIDRLLGATTVHQGLALSVAPLPSQDLEAVAAPAPGRNLILMLDQVSDPHNVGAILRSAVAFGARAVVVQDRHTAELGGACAKAAAGALDQIPVVEVTNLTRALETLAELGYWRIGLDAEASMPIERVPDASDLVLVLGAEGSGLRRLVRETCDVLARLPISQASESLNVSVAAGIALYALARRTPES